MLPVKLCNSKKLVSRSHVIFLSFDNALQLSCCLVKHVKMPLANSLVDLVGDLL